MFADFESLRFVSQKRSKIDSVAGVTVFDLFSTFVVDDVNVITGLLGAGVESSARCLTFSTSAALSFFLGDVLVVAIVLDIVVGIAVCDTEIENF